MNSDPNEIIRQAAADWLTRLRGDSCGVQDWIEFDAWLEGSPLHKRAYDALLADWSELESKSPDLDNHPQLTSRLGGLTRRPRPALLSNPWAIGAAAAATVVMLTIIPFSDTLMTQSQVYETARGETRSLILADGSHVHMNADSRLVVRMARDVREVTMSDAEAAFDVAKDAARPFVITAGDRVVKVVGTEFDVSNRGRELAVTVRRGIVEVAPQGDQQAGVRLASGQRLDHAAGRTTRISNVNPEDAFAWRSGRLIYRAQPLSVVVAELNRHFPRQVTLADPQTARQTFTGVLVLDSEKAVLDRLALSTPISAVETAEGYMLRLKR
jgi:transmembrane sensor